MPGRSASLTSFILLVGGAVLVSAGSARAHRLIVNCQVLPDHKVQVVGLYSDPFGSSPARGAEVRVLRPGNRILAQGKTDEKGEFVFSYDTVEALQVSVTQVDHEAEVTIPADVLTIDPRAKVKPSAGQTGKESTEGADRPQPGNVRISSADNPLREGIKDVLIGVGFLLALGAFVLGLRNARRLREIKMASPPPRLPDAGG